MAMERSAKKKSLKEMTMSIDGHLLSYHMVGEGDVLIFVHGLGGSGKVWHANMNVFADSYQCIAPDLIGFGNSAKPKIDYSVRYYAELLDKFMKEKGIQRATLIGHSMGGLAAIIFVLECPQRVDKLVLVSSGGLPFRKLPFKMAFFRMLVRSPLVGSMISRNCKIMLGNRNVLSKSMFVNPSFSNIVVEEFAKSSRRAVRQLAEEVLCIEELDMRKKLPSIEAATLIVWGEKDFALPVEMAHEFNSLINGSCLHVIPDAGHYVQIEKSEQFNSKVKSFLDGEKLEKRVRQ